jgi:hypothetical protein
MRSGLFAALSTFLMFAVGESVWHIAQGLPPAGPFRYSALPFSALAACAAPVAASSDSSRNGSGKRHRYDRFM